jgi:hypothetical protein
MEFPLFRFVFLFLTFIVFLNFVCFRSFYISLFHSFMYSFFVYLFSFLHLLFASYFIIHSSFSIFSSFLPFFLPSYSLVALPFSSYLFVCLFASVLFLSCLLSFFLSTSPTSHLILFNVILMVLTLLITSNSHPVYIPFIAQEIH